MSRLHSCTTADYMEWDTMLTLVRRLYRDGKYRLSLLIGCGCFFGLRISDLLTLNWSMLLDGDGFELTEKKTKKRRRVKINAAFQNHIRDCYNALHIIDPTQPCFVSRKHCVYSIQRINVLFKQVKRDYGLKTDHFSTHTMRKTFGRRVVEQAGENSEMALIKLSELYNHASPAITRRYLGMRQEELMEVYDGLDF